MIQQSFNSNYNKSRYQLIIDPSYKQSGLLFADTKTKRFKVGGASITTMQGRSFPFIATGADLMARGILQWVKVSIFPYFKEPGSIALISESPFPMGTSSTQLFALDSHLTSYLHEHLNISTVHSIQPQKIQALTKKAMGVDTKENRKAYVQKLLTEKLSDWKLLNPQALINSYNDDLETALILWSNLVLENEALEEYQYLPMEKLKYTK